MAKVKVNLKDWTVKDALVIGEAPRVPGQKVWWFCRCKLCGAEFTETGVILKKTRHRHRCEVEGMEPTKPMKAVESSMSSIKQLALVFYKKMSAEEKGRREALRYARNTELQQLSQI